MRFCVFLFCCVYSWTLAAFAQQLPPADKVADYLQDIAVTVRAENIEGSGAIKTREAGGVKVNFVWTAGHVIEGLRRSEEIIDGKTGTKRQIVTFRDARIIKELTESGRRVGEMQMDAEVIRYSRDQDLTVLRIRKRGFSTGSIVWYKDEKIPPIGTKLFHVGSLLGQLGASSMTSGIQSQIGRVLSDSKVEYDQATVTSFPGSSGGPVLLENGAAIGLVLRGAGEGFTLTVPVRRIRAWAKKAGVEWAIDDSVPVPDDATLAKLPVEDSGVVFHPDPAAAKAYPYKIHVLRESASIPPPVVPVP